MKKLSSIVAVLVCCTVALAVEPGDVLKTLNKSHPRLMLTEDELAGLHMEYDRGDPALAKCIANTIERANSDMRKPMLEHKLIGPRLLSVSRACVSRVYDLGLAYRWTGDEKYAAKCVENMLTVCAFKDWNPSHFLDVAEMTHAVGVGYDWLYNYMDQPTRDKIRKGLIRNGLEEGVKAYNARAWWSRSEHNWNQVCNAGLMVGALAIAGTDPQYAEKIIPAAVESMPLALKSYAPDGAWGEGPGYWSYATHYTAYGLTALQTALGTDFGLSDIEGLGEAGYQPIYMTGPTGMYLNYADSGERASRRPMAAMFWLARTFNKAVYAEAEHIELLKRNGSPQHVIWYVAPPRLHSPRTLDKYFDGLAPVATFRSSWTDPDALFVGVKAGYNQINHGHLDLGNFEIDALGVRWARDLGSDDYNMPNYWDMKRGGGRWKYYRLNSFSHNVVTLDGKNQDPLAKSKFTKVETNVDNPLAVVDVSSAYSESASTSQRGVAMVANRRAILVQDEFNITRPCEVTWGMTTDAKISPDSSSATLSIKDKKMIARILSPAGAKFTVESAEQKPPQKSNKGVSRLMIRIPDRKGPLTIAVLLSPVWPDNKTVTEAEVKPLSQW